MRKFAEIVDGVVLNIALVAETVPEHLSNHIEVSDGVRVGWTYADGVFTSPVYDLEDEPVSEPTE